MADKKVPHKFADPDDPFAGGILTEKARSGKGYPVYKYKGNSIPETVVDSAPAWSIFDEGVERLLKNK